MTTTLVLAELREEIAAKSKQLFEIFQEAGPDRDFRKITSLEGDTASKVDKVRQMNAALSDLNKKVKEREEIEGIAAQVEAQYKADHEPVSPLIHPQTGLAVPGRDFKSMGRLFVESSQFKDYSGQRNWPMPAELPNYDIRAAVFRTGAGWDSQDIRISRVELTPQRPIAVIDHVPMLPTSEAAILYMEETTYTDNAAETAESTATTNSDLIGEQTLVLSERSKTVEWLPVFIPVTMQQMEDVEGIGPYVDSRLIYALRARLDLQMLAGDGNTPNLEGTENVTGIQAQALGVDSIPDAIYKLFTSIRDNGFAEPSVCFIRAAKFQTVRLQKTADGIYIWGHPSEPGPFQMWGVPLVQTNAVASTKLIAGDYVNFSALYTKRGITLAVSDSHQSYFTRGMLAIRADMRIAMVHYRPKAFGEVTGL